MAVRRSAAACGGVRVGLLVAAAVVVVVVVVVVVEVNSDGGGGEVVLVMGAVDCAFSMCAGGYALRSISSLSMTLGFSRGFETDTMVVVMKQGRCWCLCDKRNQHFYFALDTSSRRCTTTPRTPHTNSHLSLSLSHTASLFVPHKPWLSLERHMASHTHLLRHRNHQLCNLHILQSHTYRLEDAHTLPLRPASLRTCTLLQLGQKRFTAHLCRR